jgi:GNAT superfamily N-acetyltransferase
MARADESTQLGELLTDAFQEPVTHWLVPNPSDRRPIMTKFFALIAEDAIEDGVAEVIGNYEGAALWFDLTQPHPTPTEPDLRYSEAFGPYAARWDVVDQLMTNNHPKIAPHHYLMVVGVRPDRQGLGLGRALIEHHHREVVDKAELPAYLEATSLDSRRLYRQLGYQDLRAPLQILMVRRCFHVAPCWAPGYADQRVRIRQSPSGDRNPQL